MSTGRSPTAPRPPRATPSGLARVADRRPGPGRRPHRPRRGRASQPGGWLAPHVHAFEEALYVLEGELLLDLGGRVHRLVAGDFALMPTGLRHALGQRRRRPGPLPVAQLARSGSTPAAGGATRSSRPAQDLAGDGRRARARPPFGDPTLRLVGHYDGTPPQLEALRVSDDPARGRAPAGMDTAILAYSGISVKMLVDRDFGADHVTMFTVDYELGGAAQAHDHPFEEAYFFLAGEVEAELDGERLHVPAGRRRVRRRRLGPRLLQHRHRARPLDRDPGAAAAGPPRLSLGAPPGSATAGAPDEGGSDMSDDGCVVVVGGTRAIGLGARPPLRGAGRETSSSPGATPDHVEAAVAEVGGTTRGIAFDLAEPTTIARRAGRRRPRPLPRARRRSSATTTRSRDYDIDQAIRLVTLKLVGYTEVVHALRRPADAGRLDRAVRRHGQGAAVSRARRRSRPSTAGSSG